MDGETDGANAQLQGVPTEALACAGRTLQLLVHRRLHLHRSRVGLGVPLPDGRSYVVFRESSCDGAAHDPVIMAVWFHLKWLPARARVRQWLFERLCTINTLLFAGFKGFRVKLWMVDHSTSDYAGLYLWNGRAEAEIYGRYITALLRPLSRPGSVGFDILDGQTLDVYFADRRAQEVAA